MNNEQKFYICKHCGNIIGLIKNSGVTPYCCGEKMEELLPNTVEASQEKHLPVVTVNKNKVSVKIGAVSHPMTPEHSIEWIYIKTEQGGQRKKLTGENPEAEFILTEDDKVLEVYSYCNLHGLWVVEV